jgi:hypothetical protein
MLSRMIRGAHMPVGFQLPVARVAFQQRNRGFPFDDIVAFTAVSQEAKCIQIQVKENINLTGADPKFIELWRRRPRSADSTRKNSRRATFALPWRPAAPPKT